MSNGRSVTVPQVIAKWDSPEILLPQRQLREYTNINCLLKTPGEHPKQNTNMVYSVQCNISYIKILAVCIRHFRTASFAGSVVIDRYCEFVGSKWTLTFHCPKKFVITWRIAQEVAAHRLKATVIFRHTVKGILWKNALIMLIHHYDFLHKLFESDISSWKLPGGYSKYTWRGRGGPTELHIANPKKNTQAWNYSPKKYLASKFPTQKNTRLKYLNTDLFN